MNATTRTDVGSADADLITRVLAGERECYSALVRRYQEELFRYAYGMGFDTDTASDMVQETLVRAYRRLRECKDRHRFRFWIVRILRNQCLDHIKNVRRKDLPLDSVLGDDAATSYDRSAELRVVLEQAFATLPVPLRDAFLLKHQAGYSYDEMAEIAGTSASAAKMRVHRAREALRACLVEQDAEWT